MTRAIFAAGIATASFSAAAASPPPSLLFLSTAAAHASLLSTTLVVPLATAETSAPAPAVGYDDDAGASDREGEGSARRSDDVEKNCGAQRGEGGDESSCASEEEEERVGDVRHEPADVAYCRRRPTWNTNTNGDDSESNGGFDVDVVREKCRVAMGYEPDPDRMAAGRHPYLSSSYNDDSPSSGDGGEGEHAAGDHDDESYDRLPVMQRPLIRKLARCMETAAIENKSGSGGGGDESATAEEQTQQPTDQTAMPRPVVSRLLRRSSDGLPVAAIVSDALSEEEATAVLRLSACLKESVPETFERRTFESAGGGNDVVFMAGFLQLVLPGVAAQLRKVLRMAWEDAGWGDDDDYFEPIDVRYDDADEDEDDRQFKKRKESRFSTAWWPDPLLPTVGIRTTEHLSYDAWKSLGVHEDFGSDYTVLVSLSNPEDYDGGEFTIHPEYDNDGEVEEEEEEEEKYDLKTKVSLKPERLSAIVFPSEFHHGVEDIGSPGRMTFANEFWRYGDVPVMNMRPDTAQMVFGDPMNQFELDDEHYYDSEDEDENEDDDDDDGWYDEGHRNV